MLRCMMNLGLHGLTVLKRLAGATIKNNILEPFAFLRVSGHNNTTFGTIVRV